MKYLVLHTLRQSELGWFSEIRRLGKETSRQRALNFDAAQVEMIFPGASPAWPMPIVLDRRDDDHRTTRQIHALRRQGKNWRLTGDMVNGQRFGLVKPGDLVIMALDLEARRGKGAFEVISQNASAASRILADPTLASLASRGTRTVQAIHAPELVSELRVLDGDLFGPYLPLPGEGSESGGDSGPRGVDASDSLLAFDEMQFEPEESGSAPEDDPSCRGEAVAVQTAIEGHTPTDDAAEWTDVPIELPEEIHDAVEAGNLDELQLVRNLLEDGVVHRCISERDLEALICSRSPEEPNFELERRVRVVLDELGIEVEPRPWDENLTPFGTGQVSSDEYDEVDDALAFFMALEPSHESAIHAYRREIRAVPVLSPAQEAETLADIEAGMREAVNAIACRRVAVEEVLRTSDRVKSGEIQVRRVVACGGDDDMEAKLDELTARLSRISGILERNCCNALDRITSGSAQEIAAILWECDLTPQYLNRVSERLADGAVMETGGLVAGLRRSSDGRRLLVASNLRLVVWWTRKYRSSGLDAIDLVGEGTLGLIRAVDRYQRKWDAKISTYASWWIRQSMSRALAEQSRLIRLPGHVWKCRSLVHDHAENVERETGRKPTPEEIASALGIAPQAARSVLNEIEPLSPNSDSHYVLVERHYVLVESWTDSAPEAVAIGKELQEIIQRLLDGMNSRCALVLRRRYGLDGEGEQTLDELGRVLGVTPERVRQIEVDGIRMLQHASRARLLAPFLGEVKLPAQEPVEEQLSEDTTKEPDGSPTGEVSRRTHVNT